MPKGALSLFDDPVAGPQLLLGALTTGLGLLTQRDPSAAIYQGTSLLSRALESHGELLREREERQRRAEAYSSLSGLLQERTVNPYGQSIGQGGPPLASQPSVPRPISEIDPAQLLPLLGDAPELGGFVARLIEQRYSPKKTKIDVINEQAAAMGLTDQERREYLAQQFGRVPSPELVFTQQAQSERARLNREARLQAARISAARPAAPRAPSEFDRMMISAGFPPGSEEYRRAAKIKAGLEAREGSDAGTTVTFDQNGNPIVQVGGRRQVVSGEVPENVDPRLVPLSNPDVSKYREISREQDRMESAIDEYEKLIKTVGPTSLPGKNAARLDSAYYNLQSQARLLAGMGAPQAAEFLVLEKQFIPPTDILRNAAETGTAGLYDLKGSIIEQLKLARKQLDMSKRSANEIYLSGRKLEIAPGQEVTPAEPRNIGVEPRTEEQKEADEIFNQILR